MIVKFYDKDKKEISQSKPEFSQFPDGQPHVKLFSPCKDINEAEIHCSIRNPLELFQLNMVCNILEHFNKKVLIYWLFGARMDRKIDDYQPETFKCVQLQLPNSAFISVLDLHNWDSNIKHLTPIPLEPILYKVLKNFGHCDIYFPDDGAKKRYRELFHDHNFLCGKKKRDSQTGKLSGFELDSGEKKSDNILIVDDICDGGGTFVGQAQILKDLGYSRLGLYTTHGLYTKGLRVLKDFESIYSTNSYEFGTPVINGYPNRNKLYTRVFRNAIAYQLQ